MNAHRHLPFQPAVPRILDFGLSLTLALPLLLASNLTASAQTTNSASRPDFSAFKLITDRNIFDPRRSPRYTPRSTRTETRRPVRSEYFTLVGIMDYHAQGPIAFFDGTSAQYQKVLKPADTIAGYKITAIEPAHVKLAVGTNEFQLPLGMQLRRDSEGQWQLAEPPDSGPERSDRSSFAQAASQPPRIPSGPPGPPGTPPNGEFQRVAAEAESLLALIDGSSESSATNAPPEAAAGSGESDPVLLRLMQRRAQEANQ